MKLVLQHNFESNIQINMTILEHVFEHNSIINTIELDFDKIVGNFAKIIHLDGNNTNSNTVGRKFAKIIVPNGDASSCNPIVVGLDLVDLERVIGKS